MRIVAFDPGRAKNRHAWTNEMKGAKSAQEIAHHSQEGEEFSETRTRSFQENFILRFRTRWWRTRGWFGDGTVLVLHNPHLSPLPRQGRGGSRYDAYGWSLQEALRVATGLNKF